MTFEEAPLPGSYVIRLEPVIDERGWFARSFDVDRFHELGFDPSVVQCGVSTSSLAGTLRGMHYQSTPHAESKLVRCTRGAIHDVIVDLRPDSPTYCDWFSLELTPGNATMLYVPQGVAHGFQTLRDETEVHYQFSHRHAPAHARGVRFDDPAFGIQWPRPALVVSPRDRSWPDFEA